MRVQTRVERIITLYLTDISALTRTPLRSARRDVMHTRVSHDIRIVDCASTERPDAVILLYIDHHDIANRWGTEYEGDADCEPVVAEINGNLTRPTMHSPPMLGETLTERLLLSRGIPTELIAPIQRMTPDELNESDQFDEQTINSVLSWYRAMRRTKRYPYRCQTSVHSSPSRSLRMMSLLYREFRCLNSSLALHLSSSASSLVVRKASWRCVVPLAQGRLSSE